jgi:hypothetical protein
VNAASSAQFPDFQPLVPGIQEDRIDKGRDGGGFCNCVFATYMDYLHQPDARQCLTQPQVSSGLKTVAKLNRVGSTAPLLGDDWFRHAVACQ